MLFSGKCGGAESKEVFWSIIKILRECDLSTQSVKINPPLNIHRLWIFRMCDLIFTDGKIGSHSKYGSLSNLNVTIIALFVL